MAEAPITEKTVLVVDDDPQLLDVFSLFLEDKYTVRTATGGEEAIEVVDETVDVALLDRRMPDLNGDKVLRAFREQGYTFPVAMVTAVEPEYDIVELPFDEYVTKPIDGTYLCSVVETLLTRAEYDVESQTFFQLASKKGALESSDELESDVEDSEEYQQVIAEMAELEASLREKLSTLSETDMKTAYRLL